MAILAVVAAVCSDVLKSSLPVVCKRLYARGEVVTVAACGVLLIVTLAFSGSMALSAALGARVETSSGKANVESDRARLQASYDGASAALKVLAATRSVAELQALATSGAGVDATVWVRTNKCQDVTKAASKTACKPYDDVTAELGRAQRRQELEAVMSGARTAMAALPAPKPADGFVLAVQRVAALWGGKPDAESIQLGAALLFVLLLELGSALGFVVADAMGLREAQGRAEGVAASKVAREAENGAGGLACGPADAFAALPVQPNALNEPGVQQHHHTKLAPKIPHSKTLKVDSRLKQALAGGAYEGTMSALAKACRTSPTTIGRRLEALAAAGVVRLDAQAGRGTRVELVAMH